MTNPIKAFDAAVQRHVDATAHGLMRAFDVTKSVIRFGNMQLLALVLLTRCISAASRGRREEAALVAIFGIFAVTMGAAMLRVDRMAESARHALSPLDAFFMRHGAFLKIVMALMLANQVLALAYPATFEQDRNDTFMKLLSWVPMMTFVYLAATPSKPPPKEARERDLVLVPIPVRR